MSETMTKKPQRNVIPEAASEHWYSMEEACAILARSRFTVAKMIREKSLDKMKDGQRTLISKASVKRWLKRFDPTQQNVTKSSRKRK